jgi:CheY-specific phosphatase CheX
MNEYIPINSLDKDSSKEIVEEMTNFFTANEVIKVRKEENQFKQFV